MANKKLINDFTSGSIPKQLVRFMLPFMASNALQVVYSLVDMVVVGRFVGSSGLSAVSQGSMIIVFATMFYLGFSSSSQIMISQLLGAGRRDRLQSVIGTLFTVTLILGAILSVVMVVLRSWFTDLLAVPAEARDMAISYVIICGGGLLFTCGYNAVSAILRGMGDSRHPFVFITISSVLNLILDLLLTGWLKLGVAGAAFATIASQAVSFIISIIFLYRRKEDFCFDFKLGSFRLDFTILKEMVRLGIPLALQTCAINVSMMVCNSFINRLGVTASATFGVGCKIDDIANKLATGVQMAAGPMIGQNYGSQNPRRVRSVVYWSWILSAAIYLIFTLVYTNIGTQMFALFTDDAEVLELAPVFIRAIIWSFLPLAALRGTNSLFQGIGNATLIMCFAFIDSGLRVILSYLLGIVGGMGFYGFTLGFGLAAFGVAIPGAIYFFFGGWHKRKLTIAGEKN